MRFLYCRIVIPIGSNLLLQPADFGKKCNEQTDLLEYEWRLVIRTRIAMRNALAQFIYSTLHARFVCGTMMESIVNVAYRVIQQCEDVRIG
jgi:hypothetical protein